MNNWLKTLIAGYAGWKLGGGGCLGFIAVLAGSQLEANCNKPAKLLMRAFFSPFSKISHSPPQILRNFYE